MPERYSRRNKSRSKGKRETTRKLDAIFGSVQRAFDDLFVEEMHSEGIRRASKVLDFFLLLILFGVIYLIASIFTSWTGIIGESARDLMMSKWGLASVIPLCYLGYLSVALLVKRKIPAFMTQTTVAALLFLSAELMLGLIYIDNPNLENMRLCGSWGNFIASAALRSIGPLGIFLLGLMLAILVGLFYYQGNFKGLFSKMQTFFGYVLERIRKFKDSFRKKEPTDAVDMADIGMTDDDKDNQPQVSPRDAFEFSDEPSPELPLPDRDYVLTEVAEGEDAEDGYVIPLDVEPGKFPPPLDILGAPIDHDATADIKPMLEKYGAKIIDTLAEFGIEAELADIVQGPTVIQFRIQIAPGIKVSRIAALSNDLALALAVPSLRVEAPILGQPYVGIEIPNPKRRPVLLREVVESSNFIQSKYELPLPLGLTVDGTPMVVGLETLPHLLVAGTTGSGKSVFISSCLIGLCFDRRPDEVKLLLIDPKRVEMTFYEKLPHVLTPPIVETKEAVAALAWAISEMERRYDMFAKARVRNIGSYNEKVLPKDRLYNLVIVVDELADLMMTSPKEVEDYICRLAQMARATGIHLILATQRPSVNVVTGLIKANIPARVAFTLPSQADSRTILDVGGAEKLLGKGDMLFLSPKFAKPVRIQAPWVDEDTISRFIKYTINIFGEPEYLNISEGNGSSHEAAYLDDPLLEEAVEVVLATGIASASRLQRQLRIGFTRAARLIDTMEQLGIVGPQEGSKPRDILIDEDRAREILATALGGDRSGIDHN